MTGTFLKMYVIQLIQIQYRVPSGITYNFKFEIDRGSLKVSFINNITRTFPFLIPQYQMQIAWDVLLVACLSESRQRKNGFLARNLHLQAGGVFDGWIVLSVKAFSSGFRSKKNFISDFGIDTLMEHVEKTTFPWLMSNVIDNETGRPLAEGKITQIIDWAGRKIGLVSFQWGFLILVVRAQHRFIEPPDACNGCEAWYCITQTYEFLNC